MSLETRHRLSGHLERQTIIVVALAAVLAAVIFLASQRVILHWFESSKVQETTTALRLVDAFVGNYTDLRSRHPGEGLPVPATFRAHSIERFNAGRTGSSDLNLYWLGLPGRQIVTAPTDESTREALLEAAASGDTQTRTQWLEINGSRVYRTIAPSVAKQQACVDCHNAYLNGSVPWKLNDIMGAFVIDVPVDGFMADARNQSLLIAVLFFVIAAPVAGLVARLMHLRRRAAIEAATSAERARVALEAQHAAEAASRSKSRFLALMSHELRTPLNAVIGFSEIIEQELSGPLPPDYRSYARDIHQSGRHLLRIIGDILDLAKAESNHMELDEEAVRLEEVVEPCLRLSAPHADKAGVSLGATLESDIIVRGDVTKLRQILLNLLSNAIKFTESGGRVRFDGSRDRDGSLSLTIVDDGMGMRQEDLPRAFSAFEQVDSTLHRRHEGAGLGLPLARALTELHGGELRIDSTIGLGTKVTVTLPAIRVTGSPASQVEEAPSLNWHVGDGLFHPAPAPT